MFTLGILFVMNMHLTAAAGQGEEAEDSYVSLRKEYIHSVVQDSEVQKCLFSLLKRSAFGAFSTERGLFLRLVSGSRPVRYSCVHWPKENRYLGAHHTGPRPNGVVMIAHTHPDRTATGNGVSPEPSDGDIEAADREQIPSLVVTKNAIWIYDPLSKAKLPIVQGPWYKEFEP